jgi:DNA-binding transcriptional regulator YhcF (GntR family)
MALCWPLQLPPTAKAVLISMADFANEAGECWPSVSTIAERTCLVPRSVIRAIKELESFGVVRAARSNGRHTSYLITPDQYAKPVTESHQCQEVTSDTESSTSDFESPDPCHKVTAPLTQSHTNHQEPSRTIKEPSEVDELLKDIDPELLRDFRSLRSRQKAPITVTAIKGFIREAGIAGYTLEQAIRASTENSWRGFKALYVADKTRPARAASYPNKHSAAAAGIFGPANNSEVIDV